MARHRPGYPGPMLLDRIPVVAYAADGPVIVWHTSEEYDRLLAGVDVEASVLMSLPVPEENDE
jgi:hypothetical protein